MPMYDGDYEWNDYYISPLFTLEAGKSYKVKSCTWKNMDPSEFNLALMLGKSQKDASAFQKISDINMQLNYDANVTDDHVFAVEETGDYRLAYLATTAAATNQKIALTNFEIEETTETPEVTIGKIEETPEPEPEPVATTAVTDFTAKEAGDLKTINLKWKNPTKDVDGNDLAADAELSVKVSEGETLLITVPGTPGADGSYSYEPETYAGLHEYKVVVVYKELESEAATTTLTVVVNGINGAIVIPADAEVSVRTLGGALVGNNFSTLAKGTYLVTVKTVDGKVKTMKITK